MAKGRKRDPGAKRRTATTRAERQPVDRGTPELIAHRIAVAGNAAPPAPGDAPAASEFPLDVLAQRGIITADMRDEGWRFAQLAWSLFGRPGGSCQGIYERMVSGGGDEFGPKPETPETDAEAGKRRDGQWAAYRGIERILSGVEMTALRSAAQYLEFPDAARLMIHGRMPSWEQIGKLTDLTNALRALAARNRVRRGN